MKRMKRLAAVFAVVVLTLSAFALTACGDDTVKSNATLLASTDTLVVIRAEKTGGSVEDAMKQFQTDGKLEYAGEEGQYGWFLTSVNGNTLTGNAYWAVYTTLGTYEDVAYSTAEYGTYDYEGTACSYALYGITGLPLVAGNLYVLTVATY